MRISHTNFTIVAERIVLQTDHELGLGRLWPVPGCTTGTPPSYMRDQTGEL